MDPIRYTPGQYERISEELSVSNTPPTYRLVPAVFPFAIGVRVTTLNFAGDSSINPTPAEITLGNTKDGAHIGGLTGANLFLWLWVPDAAPTMTGYTLNSGRVRSLSIFYPPRAFTVTINGEETPGQLYLARAAFFVTSYANSQINPIIPAEVVNIQPIPGDPTPASSYVVATATALYKLKAALPIDPTDDSFDIRLSNILRAAELEIGAPDGLTKFVLADSEILFLPEAEYIRRDKSAYINIGPFTMIDTITTLTPDGGEMPYTDYILIQYNEHDIEVKFGDTPIPNYAPRIKFKAGYPRGHIPSEFESLVHQFAAIKFFNPDPGKQVIPQFLYNQLNRLMG